MSIFTYFYTIGGVVDDWNVDEGQFAARFAFCYGSAPRRVSIFDPTPGQPVIPTTAAINSVVGTFFGVAADTFTGGRFVQPQWRDVAGNETGTAPGAFFIDNGDPDNFQPYLATLTPPSGGWTPAKVNGAALGLAMDDQRGAYPARCRWRILESAPVPRLSAEVSFTLAAPIANTVAATIVTTTSAILNATVDALQANSDYPVTVHFEYGLTVAYGTSTPDQLITGGSQSVAAAIDGLVAGLTYHFRVVATNADNVTLSTDATFNTLGVAPTGSPIRNSNIEPRRRF